MNDFTYDIVKNDYTGYYVVFKTYKECMNFKGVFHSKSKKECLEWLKEYKKKQRKQRKKVK